MVIGTEQELKADQTGDQKFWKLIHWNPYLSLAAVFIFSVAIKEEGRL